MAKNEKEFAECAVLGSALLNNDARIKAISELTADSFADKRNQIIFKIILQLSNQGTAADLVNVGEELKKTDQLELIGGTNYLSSLIDLPPISEFDDYLTQVKNNAVLRNYTSAMQSILKQSKNCSNIVEFIQSSQGQLDKIALKTSIQGFRGSDDVVKSYLKTLEENANRRKERGLNFDPLVSGLATGYKTFDNMTGGFKPGELYILAARPSIGKTAFAINLAQKVASFTENGPKRGVAFFSLEMSAESIIARMLALTSDITQDEIKKMNLKVTINEKDSSPIITLDSSDKNNKNLRKLKNGVNIIREMPLYIDANPTPKVVSIRNDINKLMNKDPNIGLIVIDYLGLIISADEKISSSASRTNIVGDISRALKAIARDFQIPVLCLSQLSRSPDKRKGTERKPTMSDLRDSGDIEQDADQVYFLYRADYYRGEEDNKSQLLTPIKTDTDANLHDTEVIIAKNRNGRIGSCNFIFDSAKCKFDPKLDEEMNVIENEPVEMPDPNF